MAPGPALDAERRRPRGLPDQRRLSTQLTDSTALYGAVSRAFHTLCGATRFIEAPLLDGLGGLSTDPDIRPTTLLAYELGARGRYFGKLDLNANLFWNEYDDVYTFQPRFGPPGLVKFELMNNAQAAIYGAELEAKVALTKSLSLLGSYAYQQLAWDSVGGIWQKDAMSPPQHQFMVGARYNPAADLHLPLAGLHLSSHLYYVDGVQAPNPEFPFVARDIAPYYRLDLLAEYEFWKKQASVAVGVKNLLDDHHPEGATLFLNSAEVPRMVWAELRIRIK